MIKLDINSREDALIGGDRDELLNQLTLVMVHYLVFNPDIYRDSLILISAMMEDGSFETVKEYMKKSSRIEVAMKGDA